MLLCRPQRCHGQAGGIVVFPCHSHRAYYGPELELLAYLCRVPKSYNNKQEYPVREKDFFTDGATPRETRVSETFIC